MQKNINTDQKQRLEVLRNYDLVNFDTDFSCFIESIATICEVPICTIERVSKENSEIIASTGIDISTHYNCKGSCTQYILDKGDFCEIEDIRHHKEIDQSHYLADDFEIRFFASHHLVNELGDSLGTFNIYDNKPRVLTDNQKHIFALSAKSIVKLLNQNRQEERLLFFDKMFGNSKDIIGIATFDGVIIKINRAISKILGFEPEEVLGQNILEFADPTVYDEIQKSFKQLTAGDDGVSYTNPVVGKNNIIRWIEWTTSLEHSSQLIYFIGRDVTEIHEKEMLLKASELRFRSFFKNSQSLMMIHDLEGNIVTVNDKTAKIIGKSIEEISKCSLFDYIPSVRWPNVHLYLKELREKDLTKAEVRIEDKHGRERIWLYNSIVEKGIHGETYVLANGVDLTHRIKMEDDLRVATKKADDANSAKSEFIANMSHEIRTPLNGIIGFTDLVLKTPLNTTQEEYLRIINQSGKALLNIINLILDFSKIESRMIILVEEKVDLQNLASDAFAMVSFTSKKKGLEMRLDFHEDLPRFVWGDEIRLKQVLVNLLSNAVKFTDEGEVKLKISIQERLPNDCVILQFNVSDTGVGIHQDKIKHIFNAFEQEDCSITKKYGGTGLGLTISNSLLELMGSKLKVESELYKGSTFSFELKLKVEEDIKNEKETIKVESPSDNSESNLQEESITILIAEDNKINMYLAKTIVKQLAPNCQIVEAGDGKEAVDLFFEKFPDFVLMDIQMPNMNGLEATKQIRMREIGTPTPIVAFTAGTMSCERERCMQAGMDDFVPKPILKKDLEDILIKWIRANESRMQEKIYKLKKLEHQDKRWLNQHVADDFELKCQFVNLAKTEIKECAKALHTAILEKDLVVLKSIGKKLKATSHTVGLTQLSKLADAFEMLEVFEEESINNLFESVLFEIRIVNKLLIIEQ